MQSHGSSSSVVSLILIRIIVVASALGVLEPYSTSPDSVFYQIISFLGAAPQVETLKLSFYSTDNDIIGDDIMGTID